MVDMERMKSISIADCLDPSPEMHLLTMNVITTINHKKESEVLVKRISGLKVFKNFFFLSVIIFQIVSISCIFDRKCTTANPTLNRTLLERFCGKILSMSKLLV